MLIAALPSGVLGPVDFCALRRLASNCLSVAIESFLIVTNKAKFGTAKEGRNACDFCRYFLPFYNNDSVEKSRIRKISGWDFAISTVFSVPNKYLVNS